MAVFGKETDGAADVTINDSIRGSRYTCALGGVPTKITVWISGFNYAANVKCAIYEWVSDADVGRLVAETEERSINNNYDPTAYDFAITGTPDTLTAATVYYLVCWADDQTEVRYSTTPGENRVACALAYGAWPDPMTGETFLADYDYALSCTYTPGWAGKLYGVTPVAVFGKTIADIKNIYGA